MHIRIYTNIILTDVTSVTPFVHSQQLVQKQDDGLRTFIGNTVRSSFIIFIPALLLTAAYSICNSHVHMYAFTDASIHTNVLCFSAGVWKVSQTKAIDWSVMNQGKRKEDESYV